jgi:HD-like signal output (HDOD) protein
MTQSHFNDEIDEHLATQADAAGELLLQQWQAGRLGLPMWSSGIERLRQTLTAEKPAVDQLARVIGADADLAVRVLGAANSPFAYSGSRPTADLPHAIKRLGAAGCRWVNYGIGMQQLRTAPKLQSLRPELAQLGQEATAVSAVAWLIAKHIDDKLCHAALLAGLTHNIGRIAILWNLTDRETSAELKLAFLSRWQAQVGARITTTWQLPANVTLAILNQEQLAEGGGGKLTSILAASVVLAGGMGKAAQTSAHVAMFSELPVTLPEWENIARLTPTTVAALRTVLGD